MRATFGQRLRLWTAQAGSLRSKIYFSEPEHLHQVGYCVTSTCPNIPKGTTCEGTTTPYYEIYVDSCTGAP